MNNYLPPHQKALYVSTGINNINTRRTYPKTTGASPWCGGLLPISKDELKKRNCAQLDIILVTGDAYVDHPSFGVALIGRFLESKGFKVGIISQPDWYTKKDFQKLGKPRLFFGITSGNVDSMLANFTPNKKRRLTDDYSPGGKPRMRPDRAVIVYTNRIKEIFKDVPVVIGGIEASLRRLAHYDYWSDSLRRSILLDSKADILVYGMGELQTLEIANRLNEGKDIHSLNYIPGTVIIRNDLNFLENYITISSFEDVKNKKTKFANAFKTIYENMNPFSAKPLVQKHDSRFIIQLPPPPPLSAQTLDSIYDIPFTKKVHPIYNFFGGVKALETVKNSITSHRGCCGSCSFCSLYFHQGNIVQSRSPKSIFREAKQLSESIDFKGTITDIGGPTANMYMATCSTWESKSHCNKNNCLSPTKCKNLSLGYKAHLSLLEKIRNLPKIKHVFIGSGIRYDLLTEPYADNYLKELCKFHISGQLKVAPEHSDDKILDIMNKPPFHTYTKFVHKFKNTVQSLNKKLFLVNYFIASHPGSELKDALELALYLSKNKLNPQQIQDFTPLPMTLSSCMYYTGIHPLTGRSIYIPKSHRERKLQRALIQYMNPKNKILVQEALTELGQSELYNKYFKYTK